MLSGRQFPQRMMAELTIPFTGWAPDRAGYGNRGQRVATNVIPDQDGYRPFPALEAATNALDAAALGASAFVKTDGVVYWYAGTATKLYQGTDNVWSDVSQAGDYTTASGDHWEIVQWGDRVIATNYTDPVQDREIGASAATDFADTFTSTEKPKAKHIGIVRSFLVVGNVESTADGTVPNRVHWSAIRDYADMDPDATTQCDYEDLEQGGGITGVVGGLEYGVIFQQSMIRRMDYEGPPPIFSVLPADRQRGTSISRSIVNRGRMIAYITEEGFFIFDGRQSIPIGDGQVDRQFWAQFDPNYKSLVSSAIDPINKLIIWATPIGITNAERLYCYNWIHGKWSVIEQEVELIAPLRSQGFTLEGLDSISTSLDDLPVSLDSELWKGGGLFLGAVDTDHKAGTFSGSAMAATIEIDDYSSGAGRVSTVRNVWPLIDGGTVTISHAARRRIQDDFSLGAEISMDQDGKCPVRSRGRYHRTRMNVAAGGDWSYAQGLRIETSKGGRV